MTLKYLLFEKDFVESQLYYRSKSMYVKKQRQTTVVSTLIIFALVLLALWITKIPLAFLIVFAIIYLATLFSTSKNRIKKTNQKVIVEFYKKRFGKTTTLEFNETTVIDGDDMRRCEIFYASLESIEEISTHFFIFLKYGEHLIIPQSEVDKDAVKNYLQSLAQQINIPYIENLKWKW